MKTLKYILSLALIFFISCSDDDSDLSFVESVTAPTNVTALFTPTTDNSGVIKITPNSEGALTYRVSFGDDSVDPANVDQGESVSHTYAEGTYTVNIVAIGITGLETGVEMELPVSFSAPIIEESDIIIVPSETISYGVEVTVENVEYGISYEVYFGENASTEPDEIANVGDTVYYVYGEAGIYTIRVVVMGAAAEVTEHEEDFEAMIIAQPLVKAPTPGHFSEDVVSIYSDSYDNVNVSEWNPDWAQSTVLSTFVVEDDNVLKYDYLNYTGIVTDYANPTDLSAMEYVHFDYWTNDATSFGFKIVNTSYPDGDPLKESEVVTPITTFGEWVSVDIPLSEFTTDMSGITQLVLSSTGETVFVDNIYFWKEPSAPSPVAGTWVIAPEDGAIAVGPAPDDLSWWYLNQWGDDVTARACWIDDEYVMNPDGTFMNVLGTETWLEPWQGVDPEACGAPIAPHDGSNPATWTSTNTTITVSGLGAYLGLAKVHNSGEDGAPPSNSVTYNYELSDGGNTMELTVVGYGGTGGTETWYIKMIRKPSPLEGTWKIAPEDAAIAVGPAPDDLSWWYLNQWGDDVTTRACWIDDEYVINPDGTFMNVLGTETWLEPWQGVDPETCGAPIAPHDGSNPATWASTDTTITVSGLGAYLGLAKVHNSGEDGAPPSNSVTYNYELSDGGNTMELTVVGYGGTGGTETWYFKMLKQ